MNGLTTLGARVLRATMLIDRAYERYCRVRSLLVTAIVSDRVLRSYNDLAHAVTPVYDASKAQFRETLFKGKRRWSGGCSRCRAEC